MDGEESVDTGMDLAGQVGQDLADMPDDASLGDGGGQVQPPSPDPGPTNPIPPTIDQGGPGARAPEPPHPAYQQAQQAMAQQQAQAMQNQGMGLRGYLASMGVPSGHYRNDQEAVGDLVARAVRNDQMIRSLLAQQRAGQRAPQQPSSPQQVQAVAQQAAAAGVPGAPQAPAVTLDDLMMDDKGQWVYRTSNQPASHQDVHAAVTYARQQQQFVRDLYQDPQKALAGKLMEPILEQAMQRFQQHFAQQQEQQQLQAEQRQAYDRVVGNYGDLFFYRDQRGRPNPNAPTPMGTRFYELLGTAPRNLRPMERFEYAKNQMAVEAYSQRQAMAEQQYRAMQYQQYQQQMAQQHQMTAGDQQRAHLSQAAYRNPSSASPSRNGAQTDYLEDPRVPLRAKLAQQLSGMGSAEPLMATP